VLIGFIIESLLGSRLNPLPTWRAMMILAG